MLTSMTLLALATSAVVSADAASTSVFPAPFTRTLTLQTPLLNGTDVLVLQQLLRRAPGCAALSPAPSIFDADTAKLLACFQNSTTLDPPSAERVLRELSSDGVVDDGQPASATGHLFKLLIPVHGNRSIETEAVLLDGSGAELMRLPVRTHGHNVDAAGRPINDRSWPDFHDDGCPNSTGTRGCVGLNAFSSYGMTPTGVSEIDLNTPEDDPRLYGPFDVLRFVSGRSGNAGFLLPRVRNGILVHTGAWANASGWTPDQPMPNSAGCVHTHPSALQRLGQLLKSRCGVVARPNTDGRLPYPYSPQGLAVVYEVAS